MGASVCGCNRDTSKETNFESPMKNNGDIQKTEDVDMMTRNNMGTVNGEEKLSVANFFRIIKIQRCFRRLRELKKQAAMGGGVANHTKELGNNNALSTMPKGKSKTRFSILGDNNFDYIGNKVKGQKEGFGMQIWKDGAVYKGQFKNNQALGWGLFKHSDGDDYQGQFINDRASGFGIYIHSNGALYEGEWEDDNQHGVGCETWSDKSSFFGVYEKGKKQGIGSYQWADGSRYEGEWYENSLHGYGIYYFIDDKIYIGNWVNNSMNGYGEFYWKDGKRYAGYYVNDKKEGFGIYYWSTPNNRAYIGFWKNGKQDGVGKYINQNNTRFGCWSNGERTMWFKSDKEALDSLTPSQAVYTYMFNYNLNDIANFLNK